MNHAARMQRLLDGLDGPLLISSLINVRYLTGFTGSNAYIYATPDGATFVTDGRYGEVAAGLVDALPASDLLVYRTALYDHLAGLFEGSASVALEAAHLTWDAQRALAGRFEGDLAASSGIVEAHRAVKDDDEVAALRAAAAAGDAAFAQADQLASQSATEFEMGERLIAAMESAGGSRAGWPPIVAAGGNASRPHHESGAGPVPDGLLLLDYGCLVDGYHSDMTRTIFRGGEPGDELAAVYAAVRESNEAGIAAVKPGAVAGDVDRVCRDVLESHGLLENFLHSTGHGVGLEIHEGPGVNSTSKEVLEPGNVVTIEPGAYLAGSLGVRIEDMVLVTEDGNEVLTNSHKELIDQ